MTPPDLRVLICEALGWTRNDDGSEEWLRPGRRPDLAASWVSRDQLPELTLDLVAQATKGLTDEEHREYRANLFRLADEIIPDEGIRDVAHFRKVARAYIDASAEQRAVAFLRVKGILP